MVGVQDRFYIDINVRAYLEDIKLFFNDSVKLTENKDIFFYAMALGVKMPTKIEGKKDGFFMTKLLNKDDETLLYSIIMKKDFDLENIGDKNTIYKKAEECANTGFNLIKEMLDSHSPEILMKTLLLDLEESYENIEDELKAFEHLG